MDGYGTRRRTLLVLWKGWGKSREALLEGNIWSYITKNEWEFFCSAFPQLSLSHLSHIWIGKWRQGEHYKMALVPELNLKFWLEACMNRWERHNAPKTIFYLKWKPKNWKQNKTILKSKMNRIKVCFIFLEFKFFVPEHFLNIINNSEGLAYVQEHCQHFRAWKLQISLPWFSNHFCSSRN